MNELRDRVEDYRIHVALRDAAGRHRADPVSDILHRLDREGADRGASRWPIAALVALGVTVLSAVFLTRSDADRDRGASVFAPRDGAQAPQEPTPVAVSSRAEIEALPAATRSVRGVNLDVPAIEALRRLQRLTHLELVSEVEPQDPVVSLPEAGWDALARLASLQTLRVDGYEPVAPASIEKLAALPVLTRFKLANAGELQNAHVEAVRSLQSLQALRLEGRGDLDDEGLALLSRLVGLRELGLAGYFSVTPQGYRQIGKLVRLEVLDLSAPLRLRTAGGKRFGGFATFGQAPPKSDDPIDASVLREIGELEALRELDLGYCKSVDDAALSHLAKLAKLERIVLTACEKVTGRGIAHLPPSLEVLVAGGCPSIGRDFPMQFPRLQRIDLGSCATLDDDFVAWLGSLPELEVVRLDTVPGISAQGWKKLAGARTLQHLSVRGSDGIDDEVAVAWSALSELRHLNLSAIALRFTIPGWDAPMGGRSPITEKGLRGLAALTKLEDLGIAFVQPVPVGALRALGGLPLRKLGLSYVEIGYDDETPDLEALRALWPDVELKWKQLTADVLERATR